MLDKKIIVFDGVCILCNSFVQLILKKDRTQQFYFTTSQSDFMKEKVKTMQFKINPMDSVIYLKDGKVLTESSAVLGILSDLGGIWKLLLIFKIIPPVIRNTAYRFCAKRRYRVFGKLETCMLPSSEWKSRFLS
jgi:predicted DCC family thiol-disulfide oxidoreductase YuxK